jgi:TonB family protein
MNCKIFPDKPVNLSALGVLIVDFKITVTGTVKDLTIEQSSGNDAYDRAVANCVAHYQYTPATDNGQPVEIPGRVKFDNSPPS